MEKTILEWLEELPEPYRSQAIKNYDGEFKDAATLSDALAYAFSWYASPEKKDYWKDLHTKLKSEGK